MFYKFIFLAICVSLFCCCSEQRLVKRENKGKNADLITENRLFKEIKEHEASFRTLSAKRVDVGLQMDGKNTNIKATLYVKRDTFVWLSLTAPLGIEVARIIFTTDSVKFMSALMKKYYCADYEEISIKTGFSVNYNCIESLITNRFIDLQNCLITDYKNSKFKIDREVDTYILSNIKEQTFNRKIKKYVKKKRKNKEYSMVLQKIVVDADLFRSKSIYVQDMDEDWDVSVLYSDFQQISGYVMPQSIVLNIIFDENKYSLSLDFSKMEFDKPVNAPFKIPTRFKKLDLK